MRPGKLVAYYRVSTARQDASGLGLDAQRHAVRAFAGDAAVVAEFTPRDDGCAACGSPQPVSARGAAS